MKKYPDRIDLVRSTLKTLANDPYTPRLKLHFLRGHMQGLYAVRLSYADRIVMTMVVRNQEIILLTIGTHDDVYR